MLTAGVGPIEREILHRTSERVHGSCCYDALRRHLDAVCKILQGTGMWPRRSRCWLMPAVPWPGYASCAPSRSGAVGRSLPRARGE